MNKLLICLLASVALGSIVPAMAQDVASAEPVVNPIIIAPPQTALARTIKDALSAAYYGAGRDSDGYAEAQKLYFFYGARHFEPIWLSQSADGALSFSPTAENVIKLFKDAAREGLRPSDYLTPDLDPAAAARDPAKMAALETAFSSAVVRYATHIHTGRLRPLSISENLDYTPKAIDATALLTEMAASKTPEKILAALEPTHPEFLALKAALANFDESSQTKTVQIPAGPTLKPGMSDARVPLLRERLALTDVPVDPLAYDDVVVAAIKTYQDAQGLDADGIAGKSTLAALNGGPSISRDDIIANMERWRWLPQDLGKFNVFVNIPQYTLVINTDGVPGYTTRVVVGATKHQTPIFSDNIRHIVVNPYWNVPSSIIRNEIAPKTRTNPGYIAGQNMELLYNGNVVSASQVDWSAAGNSFPFSVRQKPGAGNALGQIKFLFPNKHDVYLHDTPSKSLFSRAYRAYSHGCVRVQNPMDFAQALTANETHINRASLEAMFGAKERWVNPDHQIPVHLTYFTLRVEADGSLKSYDDIYGHNAEVIAALNKGQVTTEPAATVAEVADQTPSP
ncbi:L,D-transpeptidase family protein [Devosia sp.]|uniref:L,D-transpeptidase family protein n=1 Tax=Devosia sp. TaxID=1871048 RepID=UPI0032663AC8